MNNNSLTDRWINEGEEVLLHVYNRFGTVLDHGEGVCLYDIEGKEYLDFAAGIAVFALGYHYPGYDDALKEQIDKLIHTSNLFYNAPAIRAGEKLVKASGLDRVFFTNSGAEAMEGAIKLARKYAYEKKGEGAYEIIAMKHSFHGRTLGALSITGNEKYQKPFRPLIDGVKFAEYNNLESVKALITGKTCAIILETLQGEGGIHVADEAFITGIRKLCDENDVLMICDEIQCGMGRTGTMFCYQQYGIKPDVITVAKALGCGVPIGAFLCNEKAAALEAGDHGTTYGGNPLVCAAADKVLDIFAKDHILEHVQDVGKYLWDKLEEVMAESPLVTGHRGMGLMQGIELQCPPGEVLKAARERGLILISAGTDVIRFVPPLIITHEDVDQMIAILKEALNTIA